MQEKIDLYVDEIHPNVEKIRSNVDEKWAKNWAKSKAEAGHTMKNTALPRALRGQGFYGGSATDCNRQIKIIALSHGASR